MTKASPVSRATSRSMSDCPSRSPQPSESQRPGPAEASSSLISSSDLNRLRSSRRASRSSPTAAFPHPSRSSDLTPALPTPYNGPSSLANLLRSPSLSPVPAQLVPRSEIESRGEAASEEEDVEEGDNRSESGDSGDDDEPPTAGTIGEW
jgi:hypothetical protein